MEGKTKKKEGNGEICEMQAAFTVLFLVILTWQKEWLRNF
jgi:hypothetical protein